MSAGKALSEYEQKLVETVREHGCQSTYVTAQPPFGYSVGFAETVAQAEVIVLGLSSQTTGFVINQTLLMCRDGLILDDGVLIEGILTDLPLMARRVTSEHIVTDYLNSAMWYHRRVFGRELDNVVQLVWPSDDSLWPWDEAFPQDLRKFQPALYQGTVQ
ncbi:DUF4262 domain-containing protein [Sphingomonas sp. MMS24-J45]|uniref:DUF4262 domain-containing protein n=1 Tax=Sphingomonas sp. MMS24-J45 TaxID=3238806 RepID=UPI00384BF088